MGRTQATLAGAGTGAAIGTAIMPGVGTAVGAIGGGLMGYLGSSKDQTATPYQAQGVNFRYGDNMSGQGRAQIGQYNAQGQDLRTQADQAQRRAYTSFGQGQYANQAGQQANAAVTGQNINQARGQQAQALGRMQQGNDQLAAFANQPQGPSAAQAQLQQGANQAFAQQMAAARSGNNAGGQANAMRGAAFQQAGIMGNMNAQQAALRAQEGQAYHQQQLQALGAAQQGYGAEAGAAAGLRSSDLGAAQLQAGTALGAGQLQAGTAGNMAAQNLQNNNQQNQYSLGLGQLAGQQDQFTQNVYQQQLAANMGYEQLQSQNYNAAMGMNMQAQSANNAGLMGMASGGMGAVGSMLSDTREKKDIAHAQGVSDALASLGYQKFGGQYGQDPTGKYQIESDASEFGSPRARPIDQSTVHHARMPQNADLAAMGYYDRPQTSAVARFPDAPGVAQPDAVPTARYPDTDLRMPAYEYGYKNPFSPGAAPGRHVGPMAQHLEQNPATAGAVHDTPQGKMVDPGRLTMVNTSAIGEQQNRIDALEKQLAALGVPPNRTSYGGADLNALDDAYARERAYR